MKNYILGILTVMVLLAVGFFAYQYGKKSADKKNEPPPITISPTETLVGNDRDEHGCIGTAGYEWCAVKNKCLRSWEEPCEDPKTNDSDLIKQAMANKLGKKVADLNITISKNDGKYASGGVIEKNAEAGGGYFFAVKDKGIWKIVADGNGTIDCASLVSYPDYPTSMIPECFDTKTGKPVKR